jgi:hypothetical protein
VSYHGARSGAPIDWSDPEQAAAQAKIDVLRNMVSHSPLSYSEKEEQVRRRLAEEQHLTERNAKPDAKEPRKNWDI